MLGEENLPVYFAKGQQMRQRGHQATRLDGMSTTERGRARDGEREQGEEDMVEPFREYGKVMNAYT